MDFPPFAWSAETVSFYGTIFLTLVMTWGLWQQNKAIWQNRSGKSIPVAMFSFSMFTNITVIVYGLSLKNLALLVNGFCFTIVRVFILVGLWKFKGFTKMEKFLTVGLLCVVAADIVLPHKDWFFLGFSLVGMAAALMQPIEIYKNKSAGVVSVRLLAVALLNTIFWLIYAFAIDNWVLEIINPYYLIVGIATLAFWWKYRKN